MSGWQQTWWLTRGKFILSTYPRDRHQYTIVDVSLLRIELILYKR